MKRRRLFLSLISRAAVLALGLVSLEAQNILLTGGFELGLAGSQTSTGPTLGAWRATGVVTALGIPAKEAVEGTGVVYFTGDAAITQDFPTIAGRQYKAKVHYAGLEGRARAVVVRVSGPAGNDYQATFSAAEGELWKPREFTFTASGATASLEIRNVPPGNAVLDDISIVLTPLPEFTVFGTDQRPPLSTDTGTGGIVTSMRKSLFATQFNHATRDTYLFSAVGSGTVVVEAGNANQIYGATDNRLDIAEATVMGETVIIRSPWRLKGTRVKIYARELRIEGAGQIITTPNEQFSPPIDATGVSAPGSDGLNGETAGSLDIFAEKFTDASGNGNAKFVLAGGKGQAAGKGKHGADGTSVSGKTSQQYRTDSTCPTKTYDSPAGYSITYFEMVGDPLVADRVLYGSKTFPTSGQDAWPSGTPGRGGNGGALRTSLANISGSFTAGQPGAPGAPTAVGAHLSMGVCEGGIAGTPRKSEHVQARWAFLQCPDALQIATSETVDGRSFSVLSSAAGAPGARTLTTNPYEWATPLLLRKVLNDAKDDYLQNRITRVQTRVEDYASLIDAYQANAAAWNSIDTMTRLELGQIRDEMRRLRQQVANGLDYFGNPAGWVPMLSFEVSGTIFDQEIDRSLDIIYLSRWVARKQDSASAISAALTTARDKAAKEVADAQQKYTRAKENLDGLKSQAQTLRTRVINLQNELQAKENALHAKAIANTQPPQWETALRLSLKIAGTACKMIPAYQPALGAVGDGLNLGSDFDPNQPWDTIEQIPDIASTYLTARAEEAAADHASKVAAESLNPEQLKAQNASDARVKKLQDLSNASSQLSTGMKNISGFLEKAKAPSPELDAELEKLRAADPEYGQLVADIQQLASDNQEFANKIVSGIREVAELSDTITRGLLAMDGLSVRAGQSANLVDDRVNSYMKDMERRAWDRLLKYHYYMAKAYEYRMVAPYTAQLDLKSIYDKIEAIAAANPDSSGGALPEGQKDALNPQSLHSLFKALIADTTEKIIDDFQDNAYTTGASLNFQLAPGDLAALNRGEVLTLNLANRGLFQPGEEDIRIRSISLETTEDIGAAGTPLLPASSVELFIQHSGLSGIRKNGKVSEFRHYSQDTRDLITWKPKYDVLAKRLLPGPVNPASDSLLRSLAKVGTDLILYSSPSAWADLKIWRLVINGGAIFDVGASNATINLTKVNLHVVYDYTTRNAATPRRNIEVLAVRVEDKQVNTSIDPDAETSELAPDFKIDAADVNGRQDAKGRFLRIYNQSSPATVTVTAPERIGNLVFWKWTLNKADVPNAGPAITVSTSSDRRLVAFYTPTFAPSYQQNFDALELGPAVSDGSSLISDTGIAAVAKDSSDRVYLRLTDANVGGTRSQLLLQRLSPATYGFRASFDFALIKPASDPMADGLGFYLKPPDEPVDVAANPVGGYARGLGVELNTFQAPGYRVRVNNVLLPASHEVSPGADNSWHKLVIDYRTAPGESGTLSVTLDGAPIINASPVNYVPAPTDVFAFAARTGGYAETALLDNIAIETFTSAPAAPVNRAPSFAKGSDLTATASAGPQTFAGWATAISAGSPDESGQTLAFIVSNNNESLFSTPPAIDSNGTLTFAPAAGANGAATVTVLLRDNGGTDNGGVDTSAAQTFTITIQPPSVSTFVVNTAADAGPGSLRQALADAAARPGADLVVLAQGVAGPLELESQIVINDADGVTLEGAGLAIVARNKHRLFRIAPGANASFNRVSLSQGAAAGELLESYGGGVYNEGTLALTNCTLSDNSAFAGGAVFNTGTITFVRCSIFGNSASHGGAIQNEGTLLANASTFAANTATANGGAISSPFEGRSAALVHCTLSGNSAGEMGGGVLASQVAIENCIVAGNSAPSGANLSGGVIETGANLTSGDPLLAPLSENGGFTKTMALLPGSPARNAAVASNAVRDQRGLPMAGVPDLGAFEEQPGSPQRIMISRSGSNLTLSWSSAEGIVLESTSRLAPGTVWTAVNFTTAGGGSSATLSAAAGGNSFFRLRQQ